MNAPDPLPRTARIDEGYFHAIAEALDDLLAPGEFYTAWLRAETSDFVRLNRGKVRQPGSVSQCYLDIDLVQGTRHAVHHLALSGDLATDGAAIGAALTELRAVVPLLAKDPHLLHATEVRTTRAVRGSASPPAEQVIEAVLEAARGADLVGIYAAGPIARGFANAFGQRNWHEVHAFNLQWSLYHRADKAIQCAYSGLQWDDSILQARMADAHAQLGIVAMPARALEPGAYRAFLAPAAMEELAGILRWGGFSGRDLATRQSSLARMQGPEGVRLDPRVHIAESIAQGIAPAFQAAGFIRPDVVPLIDGGRLVGALTSPRTAREFGGTTNGANAEEMPEAFTMSGGDLASADALGALDSGLYIGNLWYLNYSDRPACRITGMTRFATFLVERGRIVAPVDVLRFDDTFLRMFGPNLEALTRETELRLEPHTYGERMLTSVRVPGALLSELTFTL